VRTLVPIAVNCSKNPGVTNAAPCTFLHEGRKPELRCVCTVSGEAPQKLPFIERSNLRMLRPV
jgi:hypothetical protein